MGLDTTKAFADQNSNAPVDENADTTDSTGSEAPATLTWEQYFIRSAIACYKEYTALADAATDAGMELSERSTSPISTPWMTTWRPRPNPAALTRRKPSSRPASAPA